MVDNNHKITYFVPIESYIRSIEHFIADKYRDSKPHEAEPYQHELGRVFEYYKKTGSLFYPIYAEE